jgi:hypothetical protein
MNTFCSYVWLISPTDPQTSVLSSCKFKVLFRVYWPYTLPNLECNLYLVNGILKLSVVFALRAHKPLPIIRRSAFGKVIIKNVQNLGLY